MLLFFVVWITLPASFFLLSSSLINVYNLYTCTALYIQTTVYNRKLIIIILLTTQNDSMRAVSKPVGKSVGTAQQPMAPATPTLEWVHKDTAVMQSNQPKPRGIRSS